MKPDPCTWCGGSRTNSEGEACAPCDGTGVRGRLRAYLADGSGDYEDTPQLVVVARSRGRARALAWADADIREAADHNFVGFPVRRYPEADSHIDPAEGECAWTWGQRFDRRYWLLGWHEVGAPSCEECRAYEFSTVPESRLREWTDPATGWVLTLCRECKTEAEAEVAVPA